MCYTKLHRISYCEGELMNIVIYSETGQSDFASLIKLDDETELREFSISELENYKQYNPGVIIFDMELDMLDTYYQTQATLYKLSKSKINQLKLLQEEQSLYPSQFSTLKKQW